MSNSWIRRLWEEVKDSILNDDTPLNLIEERLYAEYSDYHQTSKEHRLHYWLEDVVAKYETNKLDSFGKADSKLKM